MASTRGARNHTVEAEIIWPVRVELAAFHAKISVEKILFATELDYPTQISLASTLAVPSLDWSRLKIKWQQKFIGSRKEFLAWATGAKGQAKLLATAESVQTELVDRLYFLAKSDRAMVSRIRHFGPRDWIHAEIRASSSLIFQLAGGYLAQKLLPRTINASAAINSSTPISFEDRTLCRAADLAEFGYTTESLLLAFSVLDAAVQNFLKGAMGQKGLGGEAAEQLLRSTTTKRLGTYLDPVLQLSTGVSLATKNSTLFKKILQINTTRNDAIHNGKSVTRADAIDACKVVHDTLLELNKILSGPVTCRSILHFTGNPA